MRLILEKVSYLHKIIKKKVGSRQKTGPASVNSPDSIPIRQIPIPKLKCFIQANVKRIDSIFAKTPIGTNIYPFSRNSFNPQSKSNIGFNSRG
jgi:hypothetical protein